MQETFSKSPKWNPNTKWKCFLKVSLEICHGIKLLLANLPFLSPKETCQAAEPSSKALWWCAFNRFPCLCSNALLSKWSGTEEEKKNDSCTALFETFALQWTKQSNRSSKNIAKKQLRSSPFKENSGLESPLCFISSLFSSRFPCLYLNACTEH